MSERNHISEMSSMFVLIGHSSRLHGQVVYRGVQGNQQCGSDDWTEVDPITRLGNDETTSVTLRATQTHENSGFQTHSTGLNHAAWKA
jgi:hypothetical protein